MKEGKVQPTNVICLALGTLHDLHPMSRERSFGQLSVSGLWKFIGLLGIPLNAKKLIQDPVMTPGDQIFFGKFGFQAVVDPEGINAIDEGTLLFLVNGYDEMTYRIMDCPPPAMSISDRSLAVRLQQKRSVIEKTRQTLAMKICLLYRRFFVLVAAVVCRKPIFIGEERQGESL
ncbi:c280cdab-c9aa-4610-b1c7-946a5a84363a [Sclerotinia trifoliorum]|uniref:C280cdab-c9aa-4610-b1c7-946a5a84363a n=1 Tax=Sclerotinia trifoliorum TaxID=28548 RepID=A0A8H2ZRV9_9HELO|nr:c280cdab-c9aa-4610-b1c7-946a5a84363a [Sclerotinia trifoliorum]